MGYISYGNSPKATRKSNPIYRVYAWLALLAACSLTLSAYAAPVQNQAPTPSAPAVSSVTPVPQPVQLRGDGKVRLNPMEFIDLLYENRVEPEKSLSDVFTVSCEDIAGILADHGDPDLSGVLLENREEYISMRIQPDTLYYQGQYESSDGRIDYAAVILNNHRKAFCLIFKNKGEWLLTDYFSCGEVETSELTLGVQTAEHNAYGKQTWLTIPGLINAGSALGTSSCLWYNLNTETVELDYIPAMHRYQKDLQYRLRGDVLIEKNPEGSLQFTIQYDCLFGNDDFFLEEKSRGKGVCVSYHEDQTWIWEPGCLFTAQIYGHYVGLNEHELSVRDFYLLCDSEIYRMRRHGSRAEKEWIGALDIVYENERNAVIYLDAPGAESVAVGRYAGFASTPRLEYYEANSTLTVRPGATCSIHFPNGYQDTYTLTRYDPHTGEGKPIPTINSCFLAEPEEAVYLYTLEYATYGGLNSYDFIIRTSSGEPGIPVNPDESAKPPSQEDEMVKDPLPEDEAIALGLQYILQITGSDPNGFTTHVNATLRQGMAPFPDEWDIDYFFHERPGLVINLRMVAQTGNITFFVCFYNGSTGTGGTLLLPYAEPSVDVEDMSMKELALYYYELLPVDDQGELKRVEYKRDVRNKDGTTTVQIYVRFKSDNVFAVDLDKDSRRPIWICMYYK